MAEGAPKIRNGMDFTPEDHPDRARCDLPSCLAAGREVAEITNPDCRAAVGFDIAARVFKCSNLSGQMRSWGEYCSTWRSETADRSGCSCSCAASLLTFKMVVGLPKTQR
jgi:hypothetical protein